MFPGFLLVFQVVFLILFGLLVEYDDTGSPKPHGGLASASAGSQQGTIKVYPCKPADFLQNAVLRIIRFVTVKIYSLESLLQN